MIEVTHDGTNEAEATEPCAFCRAGTLYWYKPTDVAVCPLCASVAEPQDVPDKKTWWRREHIAAEARTIIKGR